MKVDSSTQAAAAQAASAQNKPAVKAAPAQSAPKQEYDKVSISDSAKALMAASQKTA